MGGVSSTSAARAIGSTKKIGFKNAAFGARILPIQVAFAVAVLPVGSIGWMWSTALVGTLRNVLWIPHSILLRSLSTKNGKFFWLLKHDLFSLCQAVVFSLG